MPVVFDEVIGTVEPEPAPSTAQGGERQQPGQPSGAEVMRLYLERLRRRALRLKAD